FPVPFADVLHVASAQPITNLRVLNANGSLIFESHEGKLNYSIDTSVWNAGLYSMVITSAHASISRMIVKH
ncbi:MAG: T9SS type A sorting domain-containing protein, partial [Flavobacteriales bacterium]